MFSCGKERLTLCIPSGQNIPLQTGPLLHNGYTSLFVPGWFFSSVFKTHFETGFNRTGIAGGGNFVATKKTNCSRLFFLEGLLVVCCLIYFYPVFTCRDYFVQRRTWRLYSIV